MYFNANIHHNMHSFDSLTLGYPESRVRQTKVPWRQVLSISYDLDLQLLVDICKLCKNKCIWNSIFFNIMLDSSCIISPLLKYKEDILSFRLSNLIIIRHKFMFILFFSIGVLSYFFRACTVGESRSSCACLYKAFAAKNRNILKHIIEFENGATSGTTHIVAVFA